MVVVVVVGCGLLGFGELVVLTFWVVVVFGDFGDLIAIGEEWTKKIYVLYIVLCCGGGNWWVGS